MEDELCGVLEGELIDVVQGGGGTSYYPDLEGLPSINGVTLVGDKTGEELGLVQDEEDPTVPQYVKDITESDIESWNSKATESYVDTKVAELVNSAPETLDTLGELARAIEGNKDLIDAIKVPTKTSELENDSGFITAEDIPEVDVDLSNYYTKDETYSKAEVDELFVEGDIQNLLKVSPVVTEAKQATEENPYPDMKQYFLDESGAYYSPKLEIGKTYVVEYVVDGVKYVKEDTAIDAYELGSSVPQGQGYSLGLMVVDGVPEPSLTFSSAGGSQGAIVIQGAVSDETASGFISGSMMDSGVDMPSVTLVSIRAKGESKYYTKAETEAYVEEKIKNFATIEYVDEVVGNINTALENILGV